MEAEVVVEVEVSEAEELATVVTVGAVAPVVAECSIDLVPK